jgi:hypothetical protein
MTTKSRHTKGTGNRFGPIPHGTEPGYSAHRRRGEEACAACKKAKSEYTWARKKAQLEVEKQNPTKPYKAQEKMLRIPLKLFVALYWTADAHTLAALDERFGEKRIDGLIKQSEEE